MLFFNIFIMKLIQIYIIYVETLFYLSNVVCNECYIKNNKNLQFNCNRIKEIEM